MFAFGPNKRNDRESKVILLLVGIVIGGFFASFGRSIAKIWHNNSKRYNFMAIIIEPPPTTKVKQLNETDQFLVSDDTQIADILTKKIRVLCWIHNNNLEKERIDAIQKTWGNRCTKYIVITNSGNNLTNVFNIPNDRNSTSNIENAYRFIYNEYSMKFDWFLKTIGNSYIVMENLRYKLFAYDPAEAIGVGLALNKSNSMQKYFSDKAGYALSKTALKQLVNVFDTGSNCTEAKHLHNDEFRIGICLMEAKIHFAKSTDSNHKQLFFDKHLEKFFLPNPDVTLPYPWYDEYNVNHYLDHASNYSISFCDISSNQMFVMEFLIYHLRPYGIETKTPVLPELIHYHDSV